MRAVHAARKGEVEYFGVVVNTGSRDETEHEQGLAHFVEHTIFKGTKKRRSWHIINRMESIGGELNAYTTKEETVVYTVFPRGALSRAAELVSDLICESVFPESELEKERDVVSDEISSYLDTPSEAIFDDFDENIFAGSPMAHNILGTSSNLALFTPQVCRSWLDRRYTPASMVVFYSGPSSAKRLFEIVEKNFGRLNHDMAANNRQIPLVNPVFDITLDKGLHQCHTIAGARIAGLLDNHRHAFSLLVNMIGGPGMNSLLNFELREKRGLVYTVDASSALYSDCGLITVYYGCDYTDEEKCRELLCSTLCRLYDTVTANVLDRAKKQFIGQLALSRQNFENVAISAGRHTLFHGSALTPAQIDERIRSVSLDDFRHSLSCVLPENLSFLTFR